MSFGSTSLLDSSSSTPIAQINGSEAVLNAPDRQSHRDFGANEMIDQPRTDRPHPVHSTTKHRHHVSPSVERHLPRMRTPQPERIVPANAFAVSNSKRSPSGPLINRWRLRLNPTLSACSRCRIRGCPIFIPRSTSRINSTISTWRSRSRSLENRAITAPRSSPPGPGAGSVGRSSSPNATRRVGAIGRECQTSSDARIIIAKGSDHRTYWRCPMARSS